MTGTTPLPSSSNDAFTDTPTDSPSAAQGASDTDAAARGTTVITDSVVAKIAGLAAREAPGVHNLGGSAARVLGAIRDALSSTDHSQGVSVDVGDGRVSVDLIIVAEYPAALPQVAEDARTAVIQALETLVGLTVTGVNVTINDVHFPDETEGADGTDDTDDDETALTDENRAQ
jgi:uncharacterized alkaline shock family protein YloU